MTTRSIFLAFHSPAGSVQHFELSDGGHPVVGASAYLPKVVGEDVKLAREAPNASSYIEIEIANSFVALKAFGDESCVLSSSDIEFCVPCSTSDRQYALLLRDGDQFSTSAGRWTIEWDDELNSISHSMRPPQVPQPILKLNEEISAPGTQDESTVVDDHHGHVSREPAPTAAEVVDVVDITHAEDRNRPDADLGDRFAALVKEIDQERCREPSAPVADTSLLQSRQDQQDDADQQNLQNQMPRPRTDPDTESEIEHHASEMEGVHKPGQRSTVSEYHETKLPDSQPQTTPTDSGLEQAPPEPAGRSPAQVTDNEATGPKGKRPKKRKSRPEIASVSRTSKRQRGQSTVKTDSEPQISESEVGEGIRDTIEALPATVAPVADSPFRSTRSRTTPKPLRISISPASVGPFEGGNPAVFFATSSEIWKKHKIMDTFQSLGGKKVNTVPKANIFCIGDVPLKKSVHFLLALANGCDIVQERWIIDAHRKGILPDTSKYLPKDPEREKEWGFILEDAVQRGKNGITHLLNGFQVFFTGALTKQLQKLKSREFSGLAIKLGANDVKSSLPSNKAEGKILVLGVPDDPEGVRVTKLGQKLYHRDLLSMAVLRGEVELDSQEFLLEIPVKDEETDV